MRHPRAHFGLRLVAPTFDRAPISDPRTVKCVRLVGLLDVMDGPVLRPPALTAFLQGMMPSESLQMRLYFDKVQKTGPVLEFHLMRPPGAYAGESDAILESALDSAFPRLALRAFDGQDIRPLPAQQVELTPATAQVRSSQFSEISGDAPWPGTFPSWALTAPFDENLTASDWALVFEFGPSRLDAMRRHRLQLFWRELRRGALRLQPPGTGSAPYMHDANLANLAEAHWHELLCAGEGWNFKVHIHMDSPPSRFMLERLKRDVFGDHPVRTRMGCRVADLQDTTSFPIRLAQGLPGFLPPPSLLKEAGIPLIPKEPSSVPGGPGLRIGHTSSGIGVVAPMAYLSQHTLVVGASGSGKSNLLRRLAMAHMEAGGGLAFMDPHGPDFESLLASVPASRAKDVVVVDLSLTDYSVCINPMQGTLGNPQRRSLVARRLGEIINTHVEVEQSRGPRTSQVTRDILELAMHHPEGGTLADAELILLDADFRDFLLQKEVSTRLSQSWKEFSATQGETGFQSWMVYMRARFEPFTRSLAMNASLNRPATVDLGALVRKNAIILIKLPVGGMAEGDIRLLGAILLDQLQQAAMGRNPSGDEMPFLLIADEFGSFATPSTSGMFAQLRKYGMGLCVATQSVANLRLAGSAVATSVLANTALKIFMRLAPEEAIQLDEYTAPEFPARVVSRLPNHQAVFSLAATGTSPFRFMTELAPASKGALRARRLRTRSGRLHATDMAEVLRFLKLRHPHMEW